MIYEFFINLRVTLFIHPLSKVHADPIIPIILVNLFDDPFHGEGSRSPDIPLSRFHSLRFITRFIGDGQRLYF